MECSGKRGLITELESESWCGLEAPPAAVTWTEEAIREYFDSGGSSLGHVPASTALNQLLILLQISIENETPHTSPAMDYGQFAKNHALSQPGERYGLEFPHTREQLVEMGPEWLTKAFHTVHPSCAQRAVQCEGLCRLERCLWM